jgi:hypothetical protein
MMDTCTLEKLFSTTAMSDWVLSQTHFTHSMEQLEEPNSKYQIGSFPDPLYSLNRATE